MHREISLTNGGVALVDHEDYERLAQYKWGRYVGIRGYHYAISTVGRKRMHREVMNAPKGTVVDHINGDRMDNRKANLRVCSNKQNCQNARKPIFRQGTTSQYKGVSWWPRDKKWRAAVAPNRRQVHIGYFDTEEEAALAYNLAAKEHFGEFALLNDVCLRKLPHDCGLSPMDGCDCAKCECKKCKSSEKIKKNFGDVLSALSKE